MLYLLVWFSLGLQVSNTHKSKWRVGHDLRCGHLCLDSPYFSDSSLRTAEKEAAVSNESREPPLQSQDCMQPPASQKGPQHNFKIKDNSIPSMLLFFTRYQSILPVSKRNVLLSHCHLFFNKIDNTGIKDITFFSLMGFYFSFPLLSSVQKGCIYFWMYILTPGVFCVFDFRKPKWLLPSHPLSHLYILFPIKDIFTLFLCTTNPKTQLP